MAGINFTDEREYSNSIIFSNGFTRHSNCCNEEVTIIGEVTKYYECNYCKQPCDTEILEDEKKVR